MSWASASATSASARICRRRSPGARPTSIGFCRRVVRASRVMPRRSSRTTTCSATIRGDGFRASASGGIAELDRPETSTSELPARRLPGPPFRRTGPPTGRATSGRRDIRLGCRRRSRPNSPRSARNASSTAWSAGAGRPDTSRMRFRLVGDARERAEQILWSAWEDRSLRNGLVIRTDIEVGELRRRCSSARRDRRRGGSGGVVGSDHGAALRCVPEPGSAVRADGRCAASGKPAGNSRGRSPSPA